MRLMQAISVDGDTALNMLATSPALASARLETCATLQAAKAYTLDEIEHYVY